MSLKRLEFDGIPGPGKREGQGRIREPSGDA